MSVLVSIPDTALGVTQSELQISRQQQELTAKESDAVAEVILKNLPSQTPGRIVLTPEALRSLEFALDKLLASIRIRIQQLEDATQSSSSKSEVRTIADADKEIEKMRAVLREVDELDEECKRIERVRSTVQDLSARVSRFRGLGINFPIVTISPESTSLSMRRAPEPEWDRRARRSYQTVLRVLTSDERLRRGMDRLFNQLTADSVTFIALLKRSLEDFAASLMEELHTEEQKDNALFVAQKVDQLTIDLASKCFPETFSHIEIDSIETGGSTNRDVAKDAIDAEPLDDSEGIRNDLKLQELTTFSGAFEELRRQLDAVINVARSWNECLHMWKSETSQPLPQEWVTGHDFWWISPCEPNFLESIQLRLEVYSGEEWIWDPLPEPYRPLAPLQTNLGWTCFCGETRVQAVSTVLARKLWDLFATDDQSLLAMITSCRSKTDDESSRTQIESSPSGQNSTADSGGTNRVKPVASQTSDTTTAPTPAVDGEAPTQPGPSQTRPTTVHVLVCVQNGDDIKADTIELDPSRTDDEFFTDFKMKYLSLRGWWRRHFDPRQFAFCHVSKFDKWYVAKLGWVRNELPLANEYVYTPRPRDVGDPYTPPLSEHEWRHRFYRSYQTPGVCGAVVKLPKRDRRFDLALCLSREYVWGLDVQYRISAKIVILWQVAITASGWVALGWLLRSGSGDLQTAAVPVTLIMGALMILWLPLGEKFRSR